MSAAIGTLPVAIRVHRAPPLDPPFDDELAPDVYRPPRPTLESTPHPIDEPPSPGCQSAASRFLKVCLELFNGYRPVKQMRQLLHVEHALDLVHTLVKTKAQLDQMRLRHGGGQRLACTGMRVCEPRRGVAEAAAVLTDGLRTWAMCYRLESDGTTWRCTYLRAALPSTRTLIATARMAAQAKSTNRSPARQSAQPHQPAPTARATATRIAPAASGTRTVATTSATRIPAATPPHAHATSAAAAPPPRRATSAASTAGAASAAGSQSVPAATPPARTTSAASTASTASAAGSQSVPARTTATARPAAAATPSADATSTARSPHSTTPTAAATPATLTAAAATPLVGTASSATAGSALLTSPAVSSDPAPAATNRRKTSNPKPQAAADQATSPTVSRDAPAAISPATSSATAPQTTRRPADPPGSTASLAAQNTGPAVGGDYALASFPAQSATRSAKRKTARARKPSGSAAGELASAPAADKPVSAPAADELAPATAIGELAWAAVNDEPAVAPTRKARSGRKPTAAQRESSDSTGCGEQGRKSRSDTSASNVDRP